VETALLLELNHFWLSESLDSNVVLFGLSPRDKVSKSGDLDNLTSDRLDL